MLPMILSSRNLKQTDNEIYRLIKLEEKRQRETIDLIPSENIASKAVLQAVGSVLSNKYSEGYPKRRYYQGNKFVDEIESLAVERAKKLFGVPYANVQPLSGSPANTAIFFALLKPGDTILGMSLVSGGHLTHGHPDVTWSGKYFNSIQYGVNTKGLIDYDQIETLAVKHKPKIIISGATAYSKIIDFERIGKIADRIGAYHLSDISHISGLVVGGVHPSPVPYAHIVMTTTHKSLRGPRGAIILVTQKGLEKDPDLGTKIDKAVFPGLQGGPHDNTTAGIAVCLKEALEPKFKLYAKQIVKNNQVLAKELIKHGFTIVSGGTDNHLMLVDLSNKKINGWVAAHALEGGGIIVNKNTIPGNGGSVVFPKGIRIGTPSVTSRGMKEKQMVVIAGWINQIVNASAKYPSDQVNSPESRRAFIKRLRANEVIKAANLEVKKLCLKFVF